MDPVDGSAFERRDPAPAWQAWVETAALPVALLLAGALADRRDPFLLQRSFSWLALGPLLAGLRYGSIAAMACGALQVGALAAACRWGGSSLPGSAPEVALGWLAVGLVAGEFSDAWRRRQRHLEATGDHLRRRLHGLGRAYHALRASHDRLQLGAPGRPASLRDALEAFRLDLAERLDGATLGTAGGRILSLFSAQAFVRAATLHAVDRDGRPGPAIASLGAGRGGEDDPLLHHAARTAEVASLRTASGDSEVLAAVPLVDVDGRVHAVMAIRDLPFVALHGDTLELLAILGGYVGDAIAQAQAPAQPVDRFLRSVSRARLDARRHGVPASLVVAEIGAAGRPSGNHLAPRLAARRRASDDAVVLLDGEPGPTVAILLRLADADGLASYRARLEGFAREELGTAIAIRAWPLGPGEPVQVRAFLAALAQRSDAATRERGSRRAS